MSAKEIKAHLKKAKAAIDKQDFQEAKECCKVCVQCLFLSLRMVERNVCQGQDL